ncbi:MAG TPA: HXXEE domain-containing protein [Prolixibacteraceae bacterium]|nr:HXXEE domain-containing protein [Prolixibacteraceae bacterium]HQN93167.1 HXXEE domain-containing protein [Prolixibacteraceae bacterium]HUM87927.1 HXXEE domain-containing protein [Prolixibacteraceae bacterium]
MRNLSYNKALLASGIIFTIHNCEEAIGYALFMPEIGSRLPIAVTKTNPMIAAIIAITLIAWAIISWGLSSRNERLQRDILTLITTVFFVNAFIPHIILTLLLMNYTPAVITSIVLYLPFSVYILPKLYSTFNPKNSFFKLIGIWALPLCALVGGLQLAMSLIL